MHQIIIDWSFFASLLQIHHCVNLLKLNVLIASYVIAFLIE